MHIPRTLCLFSLSGLFACSGLGIKADAGYAQLDLTGNMALAPTAGGVPLGTIKVDFEDNLGLRDSYGSPYGRVELAAGVASFTFSGLNYDKSGRGTLNASFGDIPVNAQVQTDLQLTNLKGAIHFDLLNLGIVRISPGVGVDLMDLNMDVTAVAGPGLGTTESLDVIAPIPIAFVQGEVDLGPVSGTLDVGGIKVNLKDFTNSNDTADVTFWDVEALLRWSPIPKLEVFGGYRWIHLEGDGKASGQDFAANLDLRGFILGGGIYF